MVKRGSSSKGSSQLPFVGSTIDVYSKLDNSFHSGKVSKYDAEHNHHTIKCEEGDIQDLVLANKVWCIADQEEVEVNGYPEIGADIEIWWPNDKCY